MSDARAKVAVVGDFRFPFGDAGANRIFALAKALRDGGWRPVVVSRGKPRAEDWLGGSRHAIDGIEYVSYTDIPAVSFFARLRRPEKALDAEAGEGGLDAVLVYASTSWLFVPGLIRYCRKKRLPLLADVVEWYEPSQYRYGLLDWHYFLFAFSFRFYFRRIRSMTVISRLLESYFGRRGCRAVRIPALVDCEAARHTESPRAGRLRLLYAGVPGRKDSMAEALKGMLLLTDEELGSVAFDLLGPDEGGLEALLGGEFPERLRAPCAPTGACRCGKCRSGCFSPILRCF